jgi:uncharacterized protein (TIGR00255 family)
MTVTSMTGFARRDGSSGATRWSWEIKTVNGKGLDLRLRLPPGFDALDAPVRAAAGKVFARGSCQIGLILKRDAAAPAVRVNQAVLDAVLAAMAEAARRLDAAPPRLDGLFAIKGVLETDEPEESEADRQALQRDLLAGLAQALAECAEMRRAEGEALGAVLLERLGEVEDLARQADANPARRPEAIRARLADQVRLLLGGSDGLDPDRLHQEALLLAAKVDIREELDRLFAHLGAARQLIGQSGAVGRRLDFLSQEFNREVNTLCAKANDVSLVGTGLALKAVVEQFREQVQNIE